MEFPDPSQTVLNVNQDDEVRCYGYRRHVYKAITAHLAAIFLLGIPYLMGRWKPAWYARWFLTRCSFKNADTVLVKDLTGEAVLESVKAEEVCPSFPRQFTQSSRDLTVNDQSHLLEATDRTFIHVFFYHKHVKYVWDSEVRNFVRLHQLDKNTMLSELKNNYVGFDVMQQQRFQALYGLNNIVITVQSCGKLLIDEVLNPFYIFQIASMILWSLDEYYYYASCILIISLMSITVSLFETRRQSIMLRNMVQSSNDLEAHVFRGRLDGEPEEVPSAALVPGDIIAIPPQGCVMSCDAVLISGTCIVNESMLTGESVPVTKTALPTIDTANDELYDPERHKQFTLFAGTTIIQTRFYGNSHVMAVVVRTGFSTSKGELVRGILYPKPIGFKFYRDAIRFIGILFAIASIGMIYTLYIYISRGVGAGTIVLRCLDIVTVVVPPALPAAMTVGTYYAQSRLKKTKIFCISPQRINMCGKIKVVCFDKTGTLTEDGLDFWGLRPVKDGQFEEVLKETTKLDTKSNLLNCLASCHSLTLIDNALVGDPLDIKMFEVTGWTLEEHGDDTSKYDMLMPTVVKPSGASTTDLTRMAEQSYPVERGIIRQFMFNSAVARMSVITRTLNGDSFEVFTKGAPEKLEDLCVPSSIPASFHEELESLTLQGFRVIALAHRVLPPTVNWVKAQKIKREDVEKDLTFLGFLIMQNTLKPETTPVIQELCDADIRTVMVTGDNLLTAISVARDCKMIPAHDRIVVVEAGLPAPNQHPIIRFVEPDKPDHDYHHLMTSAMSMDGRPLEDGLDRRDYHFALTGKAWALLKSDYPDLLPKIVTKGTVFARMNPEQKAQLVEELQKLDYIVSMCGDGANDCSALKAANVGISLSEAEASVAAPFTSRVANITCVPTVIREGRCALVTSFGVFKYMALYSMIQFISVEMLYTLRTNLGDTQFLYIDLVITTTVAVLMGWTSSYPSLLRKRPPGSLMSVTIIFSILAQIATVMVVQVLAYFFLTTKAWYRPVVLPSPDAEIFVCWETTTIFIVSSFQYLILAAAFSKGPPFRREIYTNTPFFLSLITLTVLTTVLGLYPGTFLATFFQLEFDKTNLHMGYRLSILLFPFFNCVISFLIEKVLVESRWLKSVSHKISRKTEPKNKFRKILHSLTQEPDWPPIHHSATGRQR